MLSALVVAVSASLLLFSPSSLYASTTINDPTSLEEMLVLQPRQQATDPITSTVEIEQQELSNKAITNLDQVSMQTPGLMINSGNNSAVFLRGIGSGNNKGFSQSISLYQDGIYLSRDRYFRDNLFDIEHITLNKGSQTGRYGHNSLAGSLQIESAKATETPTFIVRTQLGQYDEQTLQTIAAGPITPQLKGRLAIKHSQQGHYIDNQTGPDSLGQHHHQARAAIDWQIDEQWSWLNQVQWGQQTRQGSSYQLSAIGTPQHQAFFTLYDPTIEDHLDWHNSVSGSPAQEENTNTRIAISRLTYIGELHQQIQLSHLSMNADDQLDLDYSPLPLLSTTEQQKHRQQQLHWHLSHRHQQWSAGIFISDSDYDYQGELLLNASLVLPEAIDFRALNSMRQDTQNQTLYGNKTWNLTPQWQLDIGGQLQWEQNHGQKNHQLLDTSHRPLPQVAVDAIQTALKLANYQQPLQLSDRQFAPHLNSHYQFDQLQLFAKWSRTSKSGGFNAFEQNGDINNMSFRPETATSTEIGAQWRNKDRTVTLTSNIFSGKYKDLQVSSFEGQQFVVTNAAAARSQGVELDLLWQPAQWQHRLQLTYLDAYYLDFPHANPTADQVGVDSQDLTNQDLPFAPQWSGSWSGSYTLQPFDQHNIQIGWDINYRGEYFMQQDLDPKDKQGAFSLINLYSHWQYQQVTFGILIKNATNRRWSSTSIDFPLLKQGSHVRNIMPPRTISASLEWKLE